MEVGVRVTGEIVVNGQVNPLNVDTTAKNIGSYTDTLLEVLERLVALDTVSSLEFELPQSKACDLPFLLADTGVNRDGREVAVLQKLVKFGCTKGALNEDDCLVELKLIEQLVQLPILLLLIKFDVVLLKTVQSELCFIINVDFKRVLHELLADGPNLLGEGGAEHHYLLLSGRGSEDFLNITAHI